MVSGIPKARFATCSRELWSIRNANFGIVKYSLTRC